MPPATALLVLLMLVAALEVPPTSTPSREVPPTSSPSREVPPTSTPSFVLRDVAAEAGIDWRNTCGSHQAKRTILEENGSGLALFDYDLDGDLDLYLVNGATLEILAGDAPPVRDALYRNDGVDGDGVPRFVDVTARAGLGSERWGFGVAVGDVDGDGDPDLYVANFGGDILYENLGDGRFRDVTEAAGLSGAGGWSQSAAFADLDADGDLDLYVARNLEYDASRLPNDGKPCEYRGIAVACGPIGFVPEPDLLFRNDSRPGAPRFVDISASSGIRAPEPQFGLGVVAGDVDDDGLIDLYIANDSGPNFLFHNRGAGEDGNPRFEESAWLAGVATQGDGRFQAGMGVDLADADGDGRFDLFVTNFSHDHNTFYANLGGLLFQDRSYPSGLGGPSRLQMAWGTRFFDADLDADLDLYVANGHLYPEVRALDGETYPQPDQLFLGRGKAKGGSATLFSDASERILRDGPRVSRGIAVGDLDGDGDLDVAVMEMGERPSLLRNELEPGPAWIRFDLSAFPAEGTGTKVTVRAGDLVQHRQITRSGSYASSSDPRAHFGLGNRSGGEEVEVRFLDKRVVLRGIVVGSSYRLTCEGRCLTEVPTKAPR